MSENWCVFCIAIFKNLSVEQAFNLWEEHPNRKWITKDDVLDMSKLKSEMTYKAIGEIYGLTESAAYRRINRC